MPAGAIVMWAGLLSAIPSGWILCDGTNNTPDLRSKFIKGSAAGINPGATGGALTHAHADHANLSHSGTAVADHPSHTHTYTQVPNHVHPITDPTHNHTQNSHSHTQASTTISTGSASNRLGTADTSSTAENTGGTVATNNAAATGITGTNNPTGGVATGTTDGPSATLTHSVTQPSAHTISSHDAVNHEPPYYALAFIQKT